MKFTWTPPVYNAFLLSPATYIMSDGVIVLEDTFHDWLANNVSDFWQLTAKIIQYDIDETLKYSNTPYIPGYKIRDFHTFKRRGSVGTRTEVFIELASENDAVLFKLQWGLDQI